MGCKIVLISGTDFDVNGIQQLGEFNKKYSAEVVKFNKFGFIGLRVVGKDKLVKRHLSDCGDIRSMTIGSGIRNLKYVDNRWVVLHNGNEFVSERVYVVRLWNNSGHELYISRSGVEGYATGDITKAWFTFDEGQARRYATNRSIACMCVHEPINVEDIIRLDRFEYQV